MGKQQMTSLSKDEVKRAMKTLERWPKKERSELMKMTENERDLIGLLAGELEAVPIDTDGWPLKDRLIDE